MRTADWDVCVCVPGAGQGWDGDGWDIGRRKKIGVMHEVRKRRAICRGG